MPWLRLWTDILDDPELCELSDGAFRGWTLMLAAAKKHGNGGSLPDEKRLLLWLRHPQATVDRWIEELIGAGLLERDGDSLCIHGWERWQEPRDRTNAKRQADHRARHPKPTRNGVTRVSETETETETEGEQKIVTQTLRNKRNAVTQPLREEVTVIPPPPPHDSASPRDPEADRVCNLAAEIGGDIGWATWAENRLRMKDTPKAIEFALNEAVNAKVISTAFCGKVLGRVAREGLPKDPPRRNGKAGHDPPATNQPAGPMNLPPGLEVFKAESDALMAIYEQQQTAKRRKSS